MNTSHDRTETAIRTALTDHDLVIRSAAHALNEGTGQWELAAIRVAPSDAALDRLVTDDLVLGFVPDDWGSVGSHPTDAMNPISPTWRWADAAAQSYDACYFDADTQDTVRSVVAEACVQTGFMGVLAVLFERIDPEQLGNALNRVRRTYAAAA